MIQGITIEANSVVVKGSDFDALCALARENEQLRGTLSLAEEGLANYAQEVELLWVALKRYGRHTVSCPASGIFSPPEGAPRCTCGFEAVTAVPQLREQS